MMRIILILAMSGWALTACSAATPSSPIEFRRSGGFAGFNDVLNIDANGHGTLTRRTGKFEFDLTIDERNRLANALRDAGFASIPEDSTRKPLVPDEISYVIVYQNHTVKTSDTALTDKLQPLIAMFNELVDRKGR
jgi:hypothetical protein